MTTKRSEEQQYQDDVRDMAEQIREWAKENDYPEREQVMDYMHESIDGCGRVIYTWKAKMCLVYSKNDGAYFDDYGSEGAVGDGGINWSALAYCAFEADVLEELDSDGFDINADRPGYVEPDEDEG